MRRARFRGKNNAQVSTSITLPAKGRQNLSRGGTRSIDSLKSEQKKLAVSEMRVLDAQAGIRVQESGKMSSALRFQQFTTQICLSQRETRIYAGSEK